MKSENYSEIVGEVKDILFGDSIILNLIISKKVEIKPDSIDNAEELKKCVGKKIGLLNLDGKIHTRLIEKSEGNP